MSEPAAFALIEDGETRYFADRWASATLRREVMWGPEDFKAWVTQFELLDEWPEDCDGGAVVDYDKKTLLWYGESWNNQVPRVLAAYRRLLLTAWTGFEVHRANTGVEELFARLGIPRHTDEDDEDDEDDIEDDYADDEDERLAREQEKYGYRAETVEDALLDDPEEDDEDNEDDDEDDEESIRAWITLIDASGATRHRQLEQLPLDLLKARPDSIDSLSKLPPAEIPPEAVVAEGLWINLTDKTAAIWGSPELLGTMRTLGKEWKDWKLTWAKRGYEDQCAVCNTKGVPMSTVDALAKILPMILSTEQFNLGTVIGALGGGLKKLHKTRCKPVLYLSIEVGRSTSRSWCRALNSRWYG